MLPCGHPLHSIHVAKVTPCGHWSVLDFGRRRFNTGTAAPIVTGDGMVSHRIVSSTGWAASSLAMLREMSMLKKRRACANRLARRLVMLFTNKLSLQ
jgi:hypothetical protein